MSVRRLLVAFTLFACLLALPACDSSGEEADRAAPTEDASAAKTVGITKTSGATFLHASEDGTAAIVVPPSAFVPGTELTFTPMRGGGDDVLVPGFRLQASGGAQPRSPVFVAFTVAGELPADAAVFAYPDGTGPGREIESTRSVGAGPTTLVVPVWHLTRFSVEKRGGRTPAEPTDRQRFPLEVHDKAEVALETMWAGDYSLDLEADDVAFGVYDGTADLAIDLSTDSPAAKGIASAAWRGPITFTDVQVYPSPEVVVDPDEAAWFSGSFAIRVAGKYRPAVSKPFNAYLEVEGVGNQPIPVSFEKAFELGESVDCALWITDSGPFVWIGNAETKPGSIPAGPFWGTFQGR